MCCDQISIFCSVLYLFYYNLILFHRSATYFLRINNLGWGLGIRILQGSPGDTKLQCHQKTAAPMAFPETGNQYSLVGKSSGWHDTSLLQLSQMIQMKADLPLKDYLAPAFPVHHYHDT